MEKNNIVEYTGCSQEQIRWGNNDDPRSYLIIGREYIIGRPFNVYGSGEHEDSNDGTAHVIPDVYRRLSDDSSSLYLYGNGKQTRSFTHADDVAKAFAASFAPIPIEAKNAKVEKKLQMRYVCDLFLMEGVPQKDQTDFHLLSFLRFCIFCL